MELVEVEVSGLVARRVLVPPHWTRDVHTHVVPRSKLCHSQTRVSSSNSIKSVNYGVCSHTLRLERLGLPRDFIYLTEVFVPRTQEKESDDSGVAERMRQDLQKALTSLPYDDHQQRVTLAYVEEVTLQEAHTEYPTSSVTPMAVCPVTSILPSYRIFIQLVMDLSTIPMATATQLAKRMLQHVLTQYTTLVQSHSAEYEERAVSHCIDNRCVVGLWLPRAVCVLNIALHTKCTDADTVETLPGYSMYDLRWNALHETEGESSLVHVVRDELGFELTEASFSLPASHNTTDTLSCNSINTTVCEPTRQTFIVATMSLGALLSHSWQCYPVVEYVFETHIHAQVNTKSNNRQYKWHASKLRSSTRQLKVSAVDDSEALDVAAQCREDCTPRSTLYILCRHRISKREIDSTTRNEDTVLSDISEGEVDKVLLVRVFAPRMLSDRAVLVLTELNCDSLAADTQDNATGTNSSSSDTIIESTDIESTAALMERLFTVSLPLRQRWGALVPTLAMPQSTSNGLLNDSCAATWFRDGALLLRLPSQDTAYNSAIVVKVPAASRSDGEVLGALKVYTSHNSNNVNNNRSNSRSVFTQRAAVWQLLATGRTAAEQVDYIITEYTAVHHDRLTVLEQRVHQDKASTRTTGGNSVKSMTCTVLWLRIARRENTDVKAQYLYTRIQPCGIGRLLVASALFGVDETAGTVDETVVQGAQRELAQWVEGIEADAL